MSDAEKPARDLDEEYLNELEELAKGDGLSIREMLALIGRIRELEAERDAARAAARKQGKARVPADERAR